MKVLIVRTCYFSKTAFDIRNSAIQPEDKESKPQIPSSQIPRNNADTEQKSSLFAIQHEAHSFGPTASKYNFHSLLSQGIEREGYGKAMGDA